MFYFIVNTNILLCHWGVSCVLWWLEKKTSTKFEFRLCIQKKKLVRAFNIVFIYCVLEQTLQDKSLLRPETTPFHAVKRECRWKRGLSSAELNICRMHVLQIYIVLFRKEPWVVKGVMQDEPDWRRAQIKEDSFFLCFLLLCLCYSVWHSRSHLCCVVFAVDTC